MKRRVLTTITVAAALAASACSPTPSDTSSLPATSDLQRIIDDRVQSGRSTGIVAGVVLPDGTTRVAGSGDDNGRPLDGDSVFEIGSITKTFTATLLAVMVQNDEVNLDDPVASLLPAGTSVPSRDGRQITLEDLATHTSGLPRNPANLDPDDPDNPYADYTVTQLYDFLGSYELTTDPGSHFEYSNVGAALLGHALALRAGMPFEDLVRTRILEPLDMTSTGITLDAGDGAAIRRRPRRPRQRHLPLRHARARRSRRPPIVRERHAEVRGRQPRPAGQRAAPGDGVGTRAPHAHRRRRPRDGARLERRHSAAATRSSGTAAQPAASSPTSASTRFTRPPQSSSATRAPRTSTTSASTSSTPPSRSCPRRRRAPKPPCPPQSSPATSVTTTSSASTATITQAADGLTVHLPGEEPDRLYAESPTAFFFKDFDGHVNFQLDADGDVTSGTFHDQDGQMASITRHRIQITLADEVLDRYVGTYNVDGTEATITRSAEGLTAALPDGAVQLYPETTTRFFVKEVDAQVLFQVDGDGHPTGAFLYQTGQDPISITVER